MKGYTERRFAGWCRRVGWDAAWRWPAEIPPASFAESPQAARSRSRGRQTPCSAGGDTAGVRSCGRLLPRAPGLQSTASFGWADREIPGEKEFKHSCFLRKHICIHAEFY